DAVLAYFGLCFGFQLGRQVEGVVERHALLGERRRPGRKRLRRPGLLAGHVALWHGTFFNRPDRLAGDPVEYEREAHLSKLDDHVRPARLSQHRRTGRIVIPEAVVYELIVPLAFAGGSVQTDERFGEQVGAWTRAA